MGSERVSSYPASQEYVTVSPTSKPVSPDDCPFSIATGGPHSVNKSACVETESFIREASDPRLQRILHECSYFIECIKRVGG